MTIDSEKTTTPSLRQRLKTNAQVKSQQNCILGFYTVFHAIFISAVMS